MGRRQELSDWDDCRIGRGERRDERFLVQATEREDQKGERVLTSFGGVLRKYRNTRENVEI